MRKRLSATLAFGATAAAPLARRLVQESTHA